MKPTTILLVPDEAHADMLKGWGHGSKPPIARLCLVHGVCDAWTASSIKAGDEVCLWCDSGLTLAVVLASEGEVNPAGCLSVAPDMERATHLLWYVHHVLFGDPENLKAWVERHAPGCRLVFLDAEGREVTQCEGCDGVGYVGDSGQPPDIIDCPDCRR